MLSIPLTKYDEIDLKILSDKLLDENYVEESEIIRKYIIPKIIEPILHFDNGYVYAWSISSPDYGRFSYNFKGILFMYDFEVTKVFYKYIDSVCAYLYFKTYEDAIKFILENKEWIEYIRNYG